MCDSSFSGRYFGHVIHPISFCGSGPGAGLEFSGALTRVGDANRQRR